MTMPTRHPATTQLLGFFEFEHLPPFLQAVSAPCHDLAFDIASTLPDGPELTAGLRKLLEAKDCFVRQALVVKQAETSPAVDKLQNLKSR
jgi:hypothetical protein